MWQAFHIYSTFSTLYIQTANVTFQWKYYYQTFKVEKIDAPIYKFSSVAQSSLTLLRSHGLQHTRPPCPSPTLRVYSNSCPLSQWCHPTISSSVIPCSSSLQSFLASGTFQMSQLFTSGGQSIGVLASTSVLPMNIRTDFR